MDGFVDPEDGMPSRRKLLVAAAWTVPVIATLTATPAFAASGSPSVNALQLSRLNPWNVNAGGAGGPIGLNLQVDYTKSSGQYPNTISFTWALTVSGPAGNKTVASGASTIARYGTWQKSNVFYPDQTSNLPKGTYTFTLTVSVAGSGSKSTTKKIKI